MTLDDETWARIFPWLDKAQEVPSSELQGWLAQIVVDQPDVGIPLSEVLSQGTFGDDEFFDRPLSIPAAPKSRTGQQVGAYTIDTLLAEGGMGEVWLAHRSDGQFEGRYAVKLLRLNMPGTKAIERFKREGRLLARLLHVHIARLIDAGITADGQPYLLLEYIDGEHIDKYCESRSLSIHSRVRLFLDVLAAVAHAHTSLVIHRDIKPSNVLVTPEGQVKLLDFGIAKLIDPDLPAEERGQLTRVEEIALTPSYAAPEQILDEPLSTATDVYQLGVLLHVLLAGRLPLEKLGTTRADHVRAAVQETSVRMSDAIDGSARRELRGDLDAIVEKSLRRRPQDRYPTAAALSADLQRYLEHEPVSARSGIFAYRARKFIRRYRGAVVGVFTALVCLTVATAVSLIQTHKIRLERDRADQITGFMTQIFKVPDPSEARGNSVTAREILDKSSREIEAGRGLDAGVQSDLLQVMAETYRNLGLYARAHSLAQAALDARRRLLGPDDPKTLASMYQMADITLQEGHVAEADAAFRGLASIELHVLGPRNLLTLKTQDALVYTLSSSGRFVDAEKLGRQTVATETEALGSRHVLTLNTTRLLASVIGKENRFAEAEALYRQTASLQREVLGADHPDTIKTQFSLASMLRLQGRYSEAEAGYRDVLAARRRVLGEEHPETADTLTTLAMNLIHVRSRYEEAEGLYRNALAIELRQLGPDSRFTTRAEEGLANLLLEENRFAEAERLYREVLRVRLKLLGPDHTDTLLTQRNLACLILAEGHIEEAERLFRATLERDLRLLAPNDPDLLGVKVMLAETVLQAKRPQEAEVLARQAFDEQMRALGPAHQDTFEALDRLGRSLAALGRYEEAKALYLNTIDKIAEQPKSDPSEGWYAFGVMAAQSGHADDAFDYLGHAVATGYKDADAVRNDDDLKTLRSDARFARLIERMKSGSETE